MDMLKYVEDRMFSQFTLPGIDFNSLITFRNSLSDGISKFLPPRLYTEFCSKEIDSARFVQNYTLYTGYPAVTEAIKHYEKLLTGDGVELIENFADHVCVTAGATAAITFFFEYFSNKYKQSKVLLLGLNYYLFYECMDRYQLHGVTVTSEQKNRIAPTLEELFAVIEKEQPKLVVLTLPLNPSGEIYTEDELCQLVRYLKAHDILLLYDKCQLEEFASVYEFVNLNKIVYREGYSDQVIIINSISKTRSLPGARLGYIVANREILNYITYLNQIYYWNAPMIYITPFILDLLFRSIWYKQKTDPEIDVRLILKTFRNFILLTAGSDVYLTYFKNIFKREQLDEQITQLVQEIDGNYQTVYKNYQYTQARLEQHIAEITSLQGGYNFCIKLNNTSARNQLEFCAEVTKGIKIIILPEYCYNNNQIKDTDDPFWIRITAAYPEENFSGLIDQLALFLDKKYGQ